MIVSVETAFDPSPMKTVLLEKLALGPGGVSRALRPTLPEKPLLLVKLIVKEPVVPWTMLMKTGLVATVKSGLARTVTVRVAFGLDCERVTFRGLNDSSRPGTKPSE